MLKKIILKNNDVLFFLCLRYYSLKNVCGPRLFRIKFSVAMTIYCFRNWSFSRKFSKFCKTSRNSILNNYMSNLFSTANSKENIEKNENQSFFRLIFYHSTRTIRNCANFHQFAKRTPKTVHSVWKISLFDRSMANTN